MNDPERLSNQELAAEIRELAHIYKKATVRKASTSFVIAALRDRRQNADADRLEKLVAKVRAEREAKKNT